MTPQEYRNSVIGKAFDEDGAYGYQCVDGFKHFCRTAVGYNISHKAICSPTGYATSIWDNFDSLGLGQYFDKVRGDSMVDGDWAIWSMNSPSCPYSHVAMFRHDVGSNHGLFLGQNQSGHGEFTEQSLNYKGIRGGLRPKIFHQQPKEKVDQILHKGSKVQIPGTFEVVDINVKDNTAKVRINGKDYWLSSIPLKEV